MQQFTIQPCHFDIERLEREVNILLLSDLHYDIDRPTPSGLPTATEINTQLVDSIENAGPQWQPDAVIIAGDLVNHGSRKNYVYFFDLIKKLTTTYPNLRHTVFSTPGNHDISRPEDYTNILAKIKTLLNRRPIRSDLRHPLVRKFFVLTKNAVAANPVLLDALQQFEKEYFKDYIEAAEEMIAKRMLNPIPVRHPVDGLKTVYNVNLLGVTLVCHNSSFFCNLSHAEDKKDGKEKKDDSDDRNKLFFFRDLVNANIKAIRPTGPVVSFMHHPYHFLHESEYNWPVISSKKSKDLFNCFSKIIESSHLVLCGHLHGDLSDPTYHQQQAYIIMNGTSYTPDTLNGKCYPFTYALLKVNKHRLWFAMKKYIYDGNAQKYVIKPEESTLHHEFLSRNPNKESTALEAEKLRVIDYYWNLDLTVEPKKTYKFLIYQLGLYQDAFRFTLNRQKTFWVNERREKNQNIIQIQDQLRRSTVTIFKIDKDNCMERAAAILSKINSLSYQGKIYFSIRRSLLIKPDHEPNMIKITKLWADYRSHILLNKLENISIDIIYH